MLDKFSKEVLKYFIKMDNEQTTFTIACALKCNDTDKVDKAIESLLETNCIKVSYRDITCIKYLLTNKGKFFFKNNFKINFDKYLFPIIMSLISFGLGLISGLLIG